MNKSKDVVVVPYLYRVKYDPKLQNYGDDPYYVQYYGGWRTLWMWWTINDGHLDCSWPSQAKSFDEALKIIEDHKKEYINERQSSYVVTEEVNKYESL